eukprot:sb/3472450/
MLFRVCLSAFIIVSGTLWVYKNENYGGEIPAFGVCEYCNQTSMVDGQVTARDTTMTFACFIFFDMWNALSCRSLTKSIAQIDILGNKTFIYAISASLFSLLGLIYLPPLQLIFQTEALSLNDIALLVSMTCSVLLVDECFKLFYRYYLNRQNSDEGQDDDRKKLLP